MKTSTLLMRLLLSGLLGALFIGGFGLISLGLADSIQVVYFERLGLATLGGFSLGLFFGLAIHLMVGPALGE